MFFTANQECGVRRRFGRASGTILLACCALLLTGCPTEVPYQAPEAGAEAAESPEEAPPFSPGEPANPADETAAEPESDKLDAVEAPVDRYASPPKSPPSGLPWEAADGPGSAASEVPDLFAKTDSVPPTGRYGESEQAEEEADQDGTSTADFLADAYAGLLVEDPEEEPASAPPTPVTKAPEPIAKALPAKPSPATPPRSDSGLPFELPPQVTFSPEDFAKPEAAVVPKLPTTTAPIDASALDDLWADVTVPTTEPLPAAKKSVETRPAKPPADEPPPLDDRPNFTEPTAPVREELPEPPEATVAPLPEPEWEPEPEPEPPSRPAPRPARPRPAAAPGVKPLPSVPVLPFNTRHLAWLLGGKLALAELADLEGATPSEIAAWDAEVERLARELKIRNPAVSPRSSDPAARVRAMMGAASRAGGELARGYGSDHSALLEIAIKSNTLLIVAADRPDLALPVADAVRAAADAAMLPRFLWGESLKTLNDRPSAEETADAVERLHQRVESFLR